MFVGPRYIDFANGVPKLKGSVKLSAGVLKSLEYQLVINFGQGDSTGSMKR